jgi:RimJ/RimL family protein N-acetyltransferase
MIGNSLFTGNLVEMTSLNPEKDMDALSSWTADQEFVKEFLEGNFHPFAPFELKKAIIEKIKKADDHHSAYYFALRPLGKPDLIGLLVYGWLWGPQQSGRLFLFFEDNDALVKYGEETLRLGLRYAFMELSLHRLWTELSEHNPKKLLLFEKAGFLREVQRKEALFFDGKYFDQLDYSILKPEWKKLQEEVMHEK